MLSVPAVPAGAPARLESFRRSFGTDLAGYAAYFMAMNVAPVDLPDWRHELLRWRLHRSMALRFARWATVALLRGMAGGGVAALRWCLRTSVALGTRAGVRP